VAGSRTSRLSALPIERFLVSPSGSAKLYRRAGSIVWRLIRAAQFAGAGAAPVGFSVGDGAIAEGAAAAGDAEAPASAVGLGA
jgi:hypothetical protein